MKVFTFDNFRRHLLAPAILVIIGLGAAQVYGRYDSRPLLHTFVNAFFLYAGCWALLDYVRYDTNKQLLETLSETSRQEKVKNFFHGE